MVALVNFPTEAQGSWGIYPPHLPRSTAKGCFSGYLCLAFPAPSSSLWGVCQWVLGGSRCVLDSSATVSMGKIFPSLTSYPSSNDRRHSTWQSTTHCLVIIFSLFLTVPPESYTVTSVAHMDVFPSQRDHKLCDGWEYDLPPPPPSPFFFIVDNALPLVNKDPK